MRVIYTGSFNPFHNGHQYVYDRACSYFGKDNVYIGIGCNPNKATKEINETVLKQEFLKWTIAPISNNVITYDCLTADMCKTIGANLIVRGIRPGKSLEYEEDLMYWNKKLGGPETVFIPTPPEVNQISSSVIRELVSFKADVSDYVNPDVFARWSAKRLPEDKIYFGRTCSGKSHFLKGTSGIVDCDKEIWNCLGEGFINPETFKKDMKKAILDRDMERYNALMKQISSAIVDWRHLLVSGMSYDMACLGNYFGYIDKKTLSKFRLVKITTPIENRLKFMEKRGMSREWVDALDNVYRDPPYYDDTICVHYEGE